MTRRDTLTRRKPGRPSALTDDVADKIIDAVEKGNHLTVACGLAGVTDRSLYRWIKRAEDHDYAVEHGQPVDRTEVRFSQFRQRLLHARASSASRAIGVVWNAMEGGRLIEEEPVLDASGNPVRDADGEIVMKRKWTSPDGRLALQYLTKAQPDLYGQNPVQRLELSLDGTDGSRGEDGEPDGDAFSRMAHRLAAIKERRVLELGAGSEEYDDEGDEDVHEGEIVEDEAG